MKRTGHLWTVLLVVAVVGAIALISTGCTKHDAAPKAEHPSASEHPKGEHPKAEDPAKSEHPKSEHPKGEHPK